ncbi:hypothetical protein [Actinomadura madurae]|nr:hypothetical protein [Actinomadura madurae]
MRVLPVRVLPVAVLPVLPAVPDVPGEDVVGTRAVCAGGAPHTSQ